jgi:hypothetical protein
MAVRPIAASVFSLVNVAWSPKEKGGGLHGKELQGFQPGAAQHHRQIGHEQIGLVGSLAE